MYLSNILWKESLDTHIYIIVAEIVAFAESFRKICKNISKTSVTTTERKVDQHLQVSNLHVTIYYI